MKAALNLILLLFALFTFGDKSLSLTDYQIKKICRREKSDLKNCIKNLKEKRYYLKKGDLIEIPVIPYKK